MFAAWSIADVLARDGERGRTRGEPAVGSTAIDTTPLPVPDPPEVMRTHDSGLVAVHAQPAAVVTVADAVPPSC